MRLAGQVALVTGAGRGIGREVARVLVAEGWHVLDSFEVGEGVYVRALLGFVPEESAAVVTVAPASACGASGFTWSCSATK